MRCRVPQTLHVRTATRPLAYRLAPPTLSKERRHLVQGATPSDVSLSTPRTRGLSTSARFCAATVAQLRPAEDELELEDEDDEAPYLEAPRYGDGRIQGEILKLRPYQVDAVESVLEAMRQGYSRIGVSSPTGSGKTTMFTALIRRIPSLIHANTSKAANRVLILVGSVELARQAADTVKRWLPDLTVEIEQGQAHIATGLADVTCATYQTLARNSYHRLQKFNPRSYKAIIVDESHHAAAKSYIEILNYFDSRIKTVELDSAELTAAIPLPSPLIAFGEVSESLSSSFDPEPPMQATLTEDGRAAVPILGFSATFSRADDRALGKVFQTIAYHGDWLTFVEQGWLSQVKFTTVYLDHLDLDQVAVSPSTGDFVTDDLGRAVNTQVNQRQMINAWLEKAADRQSTLVFAVNVPAILSLTNTFRQAGVDARFIYERTPIVERREILAAFKAGEFPVLVNCGILLEGADFPRVDCILMTRPTKSRNLFLQMLGRGLRLSPETGKEDCLILDCVGSLSTGNIITSPVLFGLDPTTILADGTPKQLRQLADEEYETELKRRLDAEAEKSAASPSSKVGYRDYNSVFELLGDEAKIPGIRSFSRLAWVSVGNGSYVIDMMGRGRAKMSQSEEGGSLYTGTVVWRQPANCIPPFSKPETVAQHDSLPTLCRTMEAFIVQHETSRELDLTWGAYWRQQPVSEAQLLAVNRKLMIDGDPNPLTIDGALVDELAPVEIAQLTKGQAADALTRFTHGGRKVLKKFRSAEARSAKRLAKKARASWL